MDFLQEYESSDSGTTGIDKSTNIDNKASKTGPSTSVPNPSAV